MQTSSQEKENRGEIARRAYVFWEQNGRPAERDWEFWLKAEQEVLSQAKQTPAECWAIEKPTAVAMAKSAVVSSKKSEASPNRGLGNGRVRRNLGTIRVKPQAAQPRV